ncbi:response regulator [Sphingomonas naphthae]|uniref:Response regulator n=1 Tax=Sphingomonas naphthae TaxID=1813468 RepID=A0ABY7TMU4_9SPHN|nr:response regulator [Sphingomonas naphthae]WCT74553.1 response regulator [Sphingomonas naphthae]
MSDGTGRIAGVRVLIVEDETIIAMAAEDMVEDMGAIVHATAASLGEAMAAVAAGGFDIALLDINLHDERSMPAAHALELGGTPFLFTTGYGSGGPDPAFSHVPVLPKPYRQADVAAAIATALGR